MSALRASVAAGEAGPVIALSGEADMISTPQLTALLGDQLNRRALHLTIDASRLHHADSMSVQVLVTVAKTLRARGGSLVLLHPQIPVTRMLTLMGADQVITIRGAADAGPESGTELGRRMACLAPARDSSTSTSPGCAPPPR